MFLSLALSVLSSSQPKEDDNARILEYISKLPGTLVKEIEPTKPFTSAFEIWIKQPVDHSNGSGPRMWQRMFLSHVGLDRPMVLETDGYGVSWPKTRELARLLNANQLIVEHRYWGVSRPDSLDWKYLTVRQAASDHHRILSLLKPLYGKSWISTGRSKGGMAALFHKALYPADVSATIAFVAPIMLSLEDSRFDDYIHSKTNDDWRDAVELFQITALQRRHQMLLLLDRFISQSETKFGLSLDTLFEFMVCDYPISCFSRYAGDVSSISHLSDSAEALFRHLIKVVDMKYFSDATLLQNAPLIYQCITELGYHSYRTSHIDSLLISLENPTYALLSPVKETIPFDAAIMEYANERLVSEINNVIYLYGEYDPWTACAVTPSKTTNCIDIILPGKGHNFKLADVPDSGYLEILDSLRAWTSYRN